MWPRKRKAPDFLDALDTLCSEEGEPYRSTITPDMLSAEQFERLSDVYRRLTPNPLPPSSGASEPLTISDNEPKQRKRGRPRKALEEGDASNSTPMYNDSWKGVRDLQEIQLDGVLERLIEESRDHGATLFFQRRTIRAPPPTEQNMPSNKVLAELCVFLKHCTPSMTIDSIGWTFEALLVGDLIVQAYGKEVINRLATMVKKEVQGAVEDRSEYAGIAEMMTIACNVYFVCEHLGTGSLFWLHPRLTKAFLKNNVTKDGQQFDAMKLNFTTRAFDQKIERSGANQLGDAVRAHLRDVFRLDAAGSASDTTVTAEPSSANGEGSSAGRSG